MASSNTTLDFSKLFAKPDAAAQFQNPFHRPGYVPGWSELIYNNITPINYRGQANAIIQTVIEATVGTDNTNKRRNSIWRNAPENVQKATDDAWRLYLGLPQTNNTFTPSPYQPSKAQNPSATYFQLDQEALLTRLGRTQTGGVRNAFRPWNTIENVLKAIEDKGEPIQVRDDEMPTTGNMFDPNWVPFVLGTYTLDKGEDEIGPYISYYDIWDLDKFSARISPSGAPFEVYGRIYYDPETKIPIDPSKVTERKNNELSTFLTALGQS